MQEPQNIYWLFSSSAQAIAAFIAFLLTGYTLVLQMMDSIQGNDETLTSIHASLKRSYYRTIVAIVTLTGVSILFSLSMTYINGLNPSGMDWFVGVGMGLNVLVIGAAIAFVARIIDPDRYGKKATSLLQEEEDRLTERGLATPKSQFIEAFIQLEKTLRDYVSRRKKLSSYAREATRPLSFSQILDILLNEQIIDYSMHELLGEINRVRNLVVHGQQEQVDSMLVKRVQDATKLLRERLSLRKRPTP
jgi:hypothetical protein